MEVEKRFNEIKDKKSYSSPAKRLMDHLKPILSKSEEMKKRWLWELMQNATDLGDSINMKLEIFQDKLIFSHNGKPFTLSEGFDLIMPDSSKDENREVKNSVIGQFGTGFLSTHILSRIILVSGVIEDNGQLLSFQFTLDRSKRGDKTFLIESIKNAEQEYSLSLKPLNSTTPIEYQTKFTYFINETYESINGHEVVDEGLKTLEELLPYVWTFRPEINELLVIDHRKGFRPTHFSITKSYPDGNIQNLGLVNSKIFKNGVLLNEFLTGYIVFENSEIAFPLQHIQDNQYRLLPVPEQYPKLFCAFPMIGTNEFNFPVIINSYFFDPNRERDGISISQYDTNNRHILIKAKDAYLRLLSIIQDYQWKDAYNVCRLRSSKITDNETLQWFEKNIFTLIKIGILNHKLVELDERFEDKPFQALKDIYVPFVVKSNKEIDSVLKEIFEIFALFFSNIPSKATVVDWYHTIDFSNFQEIKLDLQQLCKFVEPNTRGLKEFSEEKSIEQEEIFNSLNNLVRLIVDQNEIELLDKHTLICTKSLNFSKLKGLKKDVINIEGVTDEHINLLKDAYLYLTEINIDDFLIHQELESISDLLNEDEILTFEDFVSNIDKELSNFDGAFTNENFLKFLRNLFSWYSTSGIDEAKLAKLMPYFTANKSQLYLNTKSSEELEYAFDIEISGKSKALAELAKSNLSSEEIEQIAKHGSFYLSLLNWVNDRVEDNPNKELGNLGEEFIYGQLCKKFGKERVNWIDHSAYDFIVYDNSRKSVQYYVDAKTTGRGIANSDNVPFFMGMGQWDFLDQSEAKDKYLIARVFKNRLEFNVKFLNLSLEII